MTPDECRAVTLAQSSPSRGTWIEIPVLLLVLFSPPVVPLTGDVDRNTEEEREAGRRHGRPPHGGRG